MTGLKALRTHTAQSGKNLMSLTNEGNSAVIRDAMKTRGGPSNSALGMKKINWRMLELLGKQ